MVWLHRHSWCPSVNLTKLQSNQSSRNLQSVLKSLHNRSTLLGGSLELDGSGVRTDERWTDFKLFSVLVDQVQLSELFLKS